jgi:nucleotide-binding universal stress UspA family protein
MEKILVAIDYHPTAQKIAETGFALAKSMGAKMILMHVIPDKLYYASTVYSPIMGFGGFTSIDFLMPGMIDELKKASQDFLDKTRQYLGDENIHTILTEGNVADSILHTAKKLSVDIVVTGSHSQRWLEKIIMGSVTEKLLRETTIPLLVIPTKKKTDLM